MVDQASPNPLERRRFKALISVVKQTYLLNWVKRKIAVNKSVTGIYYFKVYLDMSSYRLDRTAFKMQTAEEATRSQAEYYRTLTPTERLRIANYLNSVAYNYPENDPPRMDKTFFRIKKRD